MLHESVPQQNPFELIKYNNILVPELLTHEGREKDLEDYTKGWNDQSKNSVEVLVPTEEKTELRTAKDWYQTGAVKRWQQFSDKLSEGTSTDEHEKDLLEVMDNMRSNSKLIPNDAWSKSNDDDGRSGKGRFS